MSHRPSVKTAKHGTPFESSERLLHGFQRFAAKSWAGGVLLVLTTVSALVWANAGGYDAYHYVFHDIELHLQISSWELPHIHGVGTFINDFLMAIFFLLVGLEIKREIVQGELNSPRKAALPVAAAVGGMLVPAGIYAAINTAVASTDAAGLPIETMGGWGVPMATDIAFALGIIMLLGRRVPLSLKVFLTSLAIVDDLGALLVIAVFYTDELHTRYLIFGGVTMALLIALNLLRFRHPLFYIVPGIALWICVLSSGVHATIAGVLLAATIPAKSRVDAARFASATREAVDHFERDGHDGNTPAESSAQRAAAYAIRENVAQVIPPLHRMEHALVGWCAFCIIPLFALANAGLRITGDPGSIAADPVMLGVFFGLVVGKPVGVFVFSFAAVKLGIAALPSGVTWRHLFGAGCLAGIGFTMAIFIANLAFADLPEQLNTAKLGILSASLVATTLGISVLLSCRPVHSDRPGEPQD